MIIKGDFIYKQWEPNSLKEMKKKQKQLKEQGFILEKVDEYWLNLYYINTKDNEKVTITLLCC